MSGRAPFAWALVGPGRIANQFAEAVQGMPDAELVRVVGRDLGRAQAFARQWSTAGAEIQASTALEAALAAAPRAVLRLVRSGAEVVIERDSQPLAVLRDRKSVV